MSPPPSNHNTSEPTRSSSHLPGGVFPLDTPLASDEATGWKPYYCFRGQTANLRFLSCHASSLMPGRSPHPPHQHDEEEFLLILAGEANLVLPATDKTATPDRRRMQAGDFAYYPAGFPHTIESVGKGPVNYLMLKWSDKALTRGAPLPFHPGSIRPVDFRSGNSTGFSSSALFEGPTLFLNKFHSHLSEVAPGGGYAAHQDNHDVVIIVLEGEVEALGHRVKPHGVIFCAAGTPHGMLNPGPQPARYLVLEFHGRKEAQRRMGAARIFIKAHAMNEYRLMKGRLARLFRLLH